MRESLRVRFMMWATVIVLIIVGVNFFLDYREQRRQMQGELEERAKVITDQYLATREFMAQNQDRINYDSQGRFEFKHLNPAAVGRGIGAIFNEWTQYSLKQTRNNPREPENMPDFFEMNGLKEFREKPNVQKYHGEDTLDGRHVYRYMVPLEISADCLPCHGEPAGDLDIAGYHKEGYEVGDLGGAVSVAIPMDAFEAGLRSTTFRHLIFFLVLAAVLLTAINFLVQKLVAQPLERLRMTSAGLGIGHLEVDMSDFHAYGEVKQLGIQFQKMAQQLKETYDQLEVRVQQRTSQLRQANEELRSQREILKKTNKELETNNQLKSYFLATMSHELRTPLTSIIAFSELLLADLPEGLMPRAPRKSSTSHALMLLFWT